MIYWLAVWGWLNAVALAMRTCNTGRETEVRCEDQLSNSGVPSVFDLL